GDDISFTTHTATQASVTISGFTDIALADNLIYRAAELLRPYVQQPCAVHVDVTKHIPSGAGLGGGSSNAAVTLTTLNSVWQCQLNQQSLLQLALKLGADVPFFVVGQSAYVTGIGEHIEPMTFYRGSLLLLMPDVAISTAAVFKHPALNRQQTPLRKDLITDSRYWINDCFVVVLQDYPEIKQLFTALSPFMTLRLSGTGSAMFALCQDKQEAQRQQKIAAAYCRTLVIEI
ncbi:MAG: 4-(cytidine 5'-diphospho)-2-C-methyl-D-erythritol kinase, partial [Proteobacteria bacterium]